MTQDGVTDFGWTQDPAILETLSDHIWGADHQILTNRKDGGVHQAWVWPLGTFDDDTMEEWHAADADPVWTRVDLAWGRYFKEGCTFLIWEEYTCRAGTLEDAQLFVRALNYDTPRTKRRAEAEHARRTAAPVSATPAYFAFGSSAAPAFQFDMGTPFAQTAPASVSGGNRAQRRAALKKTRP